MAVCVFWFVCVCACACVCPLAACVLASVYLQGCVCVWVCGLCFPSCMCVCVIVPVSSLCVCLCAPSCPGCVDFLRTMSLSFAQISKRRCPGGLLPPVAGRPSMPPSLSSCAVPLSELSTQGPVVAPRGPRAPCRCSFCSGCPELPRLCGQHSSRVLRRHPRVAQLPLGSLHSMAQEGMRSA